MSAIVQARKQALKERELKLEKLRRLWQKCPNLYAQTVLGTQLTPDQERIILLPFTSGKKRILVKAGHSVGKSHLIGLLVHWFFACYKKCMCITTAPTEDSVKDIGWGQIRLQCPPEHRPFLYPAAPRMESSPDHFCIGMTASGDAAFQGRHQEAVMLIYDECVGIPLDFWTAGEGMMSSDVAIWFAFCNPTDTSSPAYQICMNNPLWEVVELSCLDHPNILAELQGLPKPYPAAVTLEWVKGRFDEWCDPISAEDAKVTDVEFPAGSGIWKRPGSLFESRVLGRWPTQGSTSVWNEVIWQKCLKRQELDVFADVVIGCDRAHFGDDFSSFVVRQGISVLHHETHNGWDGAQISGRLKQLCKDYVPQGKDPKRIVCLIDDVHGDLCSMSDGFNFQVVDSSSKAYDENLYRNKRSELWFVTADLAAEGRLDLSRLSKESLDLLRSQLMSPTWKIDSSGRKVVEDKKEVKKRLKRSPDDADGLNLCCLTGVDWKAAAAVLENVQPTMTRQLISSHGGLW